MRWLRKLSAFKRKIVLDTKQHAVQSLVMAHELNNLTVGHTKNINGHVVTRWSEKSFEVDTWGRKTVDADTALEMVRK